MKRISRYLCHLLTGLSLLLCVATVGLWGRSYEVADSYHFAAPHAYFTVRSSTGHVVFARSSGKLPDIVYVEDRGYWIKEHATSLDHDKGVSGDQFDPIPRGHYFYGFGRRKIYWSFNPGTNVYEMDGWVVPNWFLGGLFAVLPSLALISIPFRRKRVASGCCRVCGYDLRATPDRCPECGAVPSPAKV